MKLVYKYDELLRNLSSVGLVIAEDTVSDTKNVVFLMDRGENGSKHRVHLAGSSPVVTQRLTVDSDFYNLELDEEELRSEEDLHISLPQKELLGFLNTFKGGDTTAEYVTFSYAPYLASSELDDARVKKARKMHVLCEVMEHTKLAVDVLEQIRAKEQPDQEKKDELYKETLDIVIARYAEPIDGVKLYTADWTFDNQSTLSNALHKLRMEADDSFELHEVKSESILYHTSTLLPLIKGLNTSTVTPSDYLHFGDEHVLVLRHDMAVLMNTRIGKDEVFKGIRLRQSAVNILDHILKTEESITIARSPINSNSQGQLYIKTDTSSLFFIYDTKLSSGDIFVKSFTKESYVQLSRRYLRSIINRLNLAGTTTSVRIDSKQRTITLSNSVYTQSISYIADKGLEEYNELAFTITPNILDRAIIGSDSEFSNDLLFYICKGVNDHLIIADTEDDWFAALRLDIKVKR